jgi:cytochrome bd-type quinol oxidase subunit 1
MTLQFAFSTLLPLITFAVLAAATLRLVRRQLLPGKTRIALPLFVFATACELAVFVAGWLFLFDETGRFRGEVQNWVVLVFTVVEPLARLSALSAAVVVFFGVKGARSAAAP